MSPLKLSAAALGVFASLHAFPAFGETTFMLGGAAIYSPDYEGSDDYEVMALPYVDIKWTNTEAKTETEGYAFGTGIYDASLSVVDGLDVGLARIATPDGDIMIRPGLAYKFGRDADDNDALRGLGDIEGQVLATLAFEKEGKDGRPGGLRYGLEFAFDVSGETDGHTIEGHVGYEYVLSPRWLVGTSLSTTWADDDYMQSYFGISGSQAASSVYSQYDAEGGFKDIGLSVDTRYSLTESWGLFGQMSYDYLLGDAADSPLVDDEGSAGQFRVVTGFAYRF